MDRINDSRDLRHAYEQIAFIREIIQQFGRNEKAAELIKKYKLMIRAFNKQQNTDKIVKDYGIDGYIVLKEFPDVSDPEEYFRENEYIECRPSAYDCTGQAFTSWHKIFKRNGKTMCYHRIAYDV